ncbi:MAG TPA: glycosyltransferase family 4 protein [Candidatus Eisenbacteria bacterium]
MKLLLVVDDLQATSLDEPGLWLTDLATRWPQRGHRVEVVCVQAAAPPIDPPDGVVVHAPGPDGFENALGACLESRPDVVHVASRGPLGPRVVEILRDLPVLLDIHDFWPICPAGDLMRRPRLLPCGEHYPFHGCGACAGLARLRAMEERSQVVAAAGVLLAHSVFNRVRLNAGLGRAVELIDYGVDTSRYCPDPDPPWQPQIMEMFASRERPRAIFLGPPTAARGGERVIDLLVALRARLPDIEMVVAGRDPDNPDWDRVIGVEVKELGLERNIRLLPSVPLRDLPALYASCQVAFSPLLGSEPGGLFVEHALACGLPIVANPHGAIQDLVQDGREGIFVSSRETAAFADALCALLMDPNARVCFGEAARLKAVESHDVQRSLFQLEELHHRIRENGRRAAA